VPVAAKPAAKPLAKKPSIFNADDDDEPQVMKAQLEKEMERKKKAKQVDSSLLALLKRIFKDISFLSLTGC